MAEFVFKKMVEERHLSGMFDAASCAISSEEIWNGRGNPVYPPARRILAEHGISCEGKRAVQIRREDYAQYDYIVAMEQHHIRHMQRLFGGDPEGKISLLLQWAGKPGREIEDPWYTRNFRGVLRQIEEGCEGLLAALRNG